MPEPINAQPVRSLPQFRWNATAGRYIAPNGRFVSQATIRAGLDSFITSSTNAMQTVSQKLIAGEVSLAQWQAEMMILTKDANLAGAALERGGWYSMEPKNFGRAGQKIRGEYTYLNNFADEIASGKQRLDGTLVNRAKLYGEQGRVSYYDSAAASAREGGFDEERSYLTPADSCDVCVSEDAKGWQPMGDMIPIGDRTCLSNCRCYVKYRRKEDGRTRTV